VLENELEKLQGTKFQLEMHANTLESANLNRETMKAMKTAADALKKIHGDLYYLSTILLESMRSYVGV
jgi:charged multivesicular body protein 4A/B